MISAKNVTAASLFRRLFVRLIPAIHMPGTAMGYCVAGLQTNR